VISPTVEIGRYCLRRKFLWHHQDVEGTSESLVVFTSAREVLLSQLGRQRFASGLGLSGAILGTGLRCGMAAEVDANQDHVAGELHSSGIFSLATKHCKVPG
jgi:hypothetical protein